MFKSNENDNNYSRSKLHDNANHNNSLTRNNSLSKSSIYKSPNCNSGAYNNNKKFNTSVCTEENKLKEMNKAEKN